MLWAFCSLICACTSAAALTDVRREVLAEFSTFDTVIPALSPVTEIRLKRHTRNDEHHSGRRRLQFHAFGKSFDLELRLNPNLVAEGFQVAVHDGSGIRTSRPVPEKCHFTGRLKNEPDSNAAINICRGGVSGFIQDGHGNTYYLTPDDSQPGKIVVTRDSDRTNPVKEICGVDLDTIEHAMDSANSVKSPDRVRRSLSQPSSSDRNSLYIELVFVGDVKLFGKYKKNETLVTNRFIEIASIVNALYTPLDIFVVLSGVEIWTVTDKIAVSNDSETTLKNFLLYRKKDLIPRMPNDVAYLITFGTFEGSVVGKALKGQMCSYEYSGGIAKDHHPLAGPVGSTVAHEMGHNFGMEHDFTDCQCPDDRCIMTPASVGQTPSNWSSCSRKYLADNLARGVGACLKRPPKKVIGPFCGNGFLEAGEECDCGPEEFCRNKCCSAATCTLSINSTCGHGSCCDMETCAPKAAATPCRTPSGECDLTEYCDGITGLCPDDFWKADGVPCQEDQAYCFDGSCKTHNDQCQYLWGSTGAVADDKCFKLNVKGNPNGNCGHDRVNDNYTTCELSNTKCGLLHCTSQVDRLAVGADSSTSISQAFIPASTTYISCKTAYIDLGLSVPDPGLVPNGAKCGPDQMCVNQVCTPIERLPHLCPRKCGSAGVCNNAGHCHCDVGYSPPDCSGSGYGGSIDSGPPTTVDTYRRFRDAMLIIFLAIVPAIGVVLYLFRHRIRDWCSMQQKLRRSRRPPPPATTAPMAKKPAAKNHPSVRGLRISEPVPAKESPVNDTVVVFHNGNGKIHTQLSPESWPVYKEPVYKENGFGGRPPPLPSKPPKAVRDLPVATVSPTVAVSTYVSPSALPLPSTGDLLKEKKDPPTVEDASPSLKPVRRAPAPPPRPPVPVSRNSSTTSSSRRQRPLVRPPDPPGGQKSGGKKSAADKSVIAGTSNNFPLAEPSSQPPKNTLVSELARKFESRRNAAAVRDEEDDSTA